MRLSTEGNDAGPSPAEGIMKNKKPDFIKCCKCDKEAEFTSPKNYCFEHWSAWWFSSDIKEGKMTEKEVSDL